MNIKERQKMDARKTPKCHPRALARSVAKAEFNRRGYDNVNKRFIYRGMLAPSYFATHWRGVVSNG